MSWEKTYSIANDTEFGKVAPDVLKEEIEDELSLTVSYIDTDEDDLLVVLTSTPTQQQEDDLDDVVAEHDGIPEVTTKPPTDSDGAPLTRHKITKSGWGLQCHSVNIETSKHGSLYDKDKEGNDYGFGTMKFYRDDSGNEVEITDKGNYDTLQDRLDAECIRTDLSWEPSFDIEMIGGELWQGEKPTSNIYCWFFHNLSGHEFCSGGMNAKMLDAGHKEMDGRAPKLLPCDNPIDGTGKLTFRARHDAGKKHEFMLILELYKA